MLNRKLCFGLGFRSFFFLLLCLVSTALGILNMIFVHTGSQEAQDALISAKLYFKWSDYLAICFEFE